MELLTVAACLYRVHHDVLSSHEGQLCHQMLLDDLRIYHQAVHHVQAQIQDAVDGEEALRNGETLVGGVIQGTLKPLGCGGDGRVQGIHHHIAGQGSDALAAHGVSLICHGGGTDLVLLKGLLHLFQMLKQTDIVGELVGALAAMPARTFSTRVSTFLE